jgi:hypothetical protein
VGAVTVSVVDPVTEPDVALIVVLPGAIVVAKPVALIVATLDPDEPQVTVPVRSFVLLSV